MKNNLILETDRKKAKEGEFVEIRWDCPSCPDSLILILDSCYSQYSAIMLQQLPDLRRQFNKQHIAMAKLKITEICRNRWNRSTRRDVYINGKHSGIITTGELDLDVESGPCEVTVQNIFPAFRSTAYINIEDQADNHVVFKDTKWFANFLMAANLLLIFLRGLVPMPKIVKQISNLYVFGWLLFSIFNHNDYFKTFAYSRVSICDANS